MPDDTIKIEICDGQYHHIKNWFYALELRVLNADYGCAKVVLLQTDMNLCTPIKAVK